MKPKFRNLFLASTALLASPSLYATSLYWDGNTTTAGAGNTTAFLNRTWGTFAAWNTDPTGGAAGAFQTATLNTDDLFFVAGPSATSGNVNYVVTVSGAQVANSLNFQAQGTTTISGGTSITLGSGGINKGQFAYGSTAQGAVSISTAVILDSSQTWTNNSASALSVTGTVNTGAIASPGNYTLTLDGTGTTNVTGVISGTGNLVKNGTGRVSFGGSTNANTYTGTTTINGGILSIANNSASLGGGNLILNGGVLGFYWSSGLTRTLGTGDNQVQILGGNSGFGGDGATGPTVNLGATVKWGTVGEGATGFFNPGKFVLGSADTTNAGNITFSSAIDLNGATRTIIAPKGLSATTNTATVSGVISTSAGTAGLIKEGGGQLNLSVANTYNGGTTVSEGTLSASTSASRLGSNVVGNDISVSAGARLLLNNVANVGNNQTITLNNTGSSLSVLGLQFNALPTAAVTFGSNTGVLAINTNGYNTNLTSTLSGNSIFLGSTGSGTFSGGAATIAAGTGNVYRLGGGGGTLTISGTNALTGSNSVVIGSSATNGSGTVIFSAAQDYSGGLTLNAGSAISSIGAGTYGGFGSGTVTINGGTLQTTSGSPTVTFANNMNWNANFIVDRASGGTPTVNWDGDITLNTNVTMGGTQAGGNYNQIINGDIGQDIGGRSLSFTTVGTGGRQFVTLNGNNTFTGNISITQGSLTIGGSGRLGGGDYSGNISITGGSQGPITYSSSSDQILRGVISGGTGLALVKDTSSTSTLTLTGTSLYNGATTVNAGKLTIASTGNINTTSGVSIGAGEFNYNSSTALTKAVTFSGTGGTLSGNGTINQAVNVTAGNTLSVGNSPGQMNFANTLGLAGTTIMEIDGIAGAGVTGGHDFVNLTGVGAAGVLTYGGLMTLDIGTIFGEGVYSWNLFDMASETSTFSTISLADQYSGNLLDGDLDGIWDLTSGVNTWQFTESTGVLSLNVTAIPEPNAAALLGALGTLLLLRRRR